MYSACMLVVLLRGTLRLQSDQPNVRATLLGIRTARSRRRVAVPTPKMVDPYIMRSRLDVERAAILGCAPVTL